MPWEALGMQRRNKVRVILRRKKKRNSEVGGEQKSPNWGILHGKLSFRLVKLGPGQVGNASCSLTQLTEV